MKRLSVYLCLLLLVALSLSAQNDCLKRTQEIDDLIRKGQFEEAKKRSGYYKEKGDCKDYEKVFINAINLCNKHLQQDTTHTEKPIKKGTFRLQRNKITIPANKDDGASELMFDISFIATPKSWEVESMPSWVEEISVSVKDKSASFFADDNTSFEPRAGEIVFTSENGQSATIQIVQEGRNMNFKADKRNLSYDDFGGTQTVGITAEGDWSVASNPSWILCLKEDEQLTVWCEQNGGWSREDDIVLTNDYGQEITITVRQDKTRDFLRASTSSFRDKKGAGGEGDITVSCNSYWSVAETNDWITATKNGDNLHIVVQPNKTPYERSGYVKLKSPKSNPYESRHTYGEVSNKIYIEPQYIYTTIKVEQASLGEYISVSSDIVTDDSGMGGKITIEVETSAGEYYIASKPTWCSISEQTSTSFVLVMVNNMGGAARSGEVMLRAGSASKAITVNQGGRSTYVSVSPNIVTATEAGGEITIEVKSSGSWSVVNLPDWCEVTDQTANSFLLSISENVEGSSRVGEFYVSSQGMRDKITVEQE